MNARPSIFRDAGMDPFGRAGPITLFEELIEMQRARSAATGLGVSDRLDRIDREPN